ncbi:terminase small subunit [Peptostreptococcus faecalis]|uniref:terminase small subunit n=1 Tax=Peptostreptococcus faecalis TaxID=2045015 RepID=UPI001A9A3FD6|nr:terminase small subunit [Peptostreptococcus faecalis]
MIKKKLTIKQQKFADEYIISGNATESYKKAGYKCSSNEVASANAVRLLGNDKVKNYIDGKMKEINNSNIMTMEEVMQRLTLIANDKIHEEVVTATGQVVKKGVSIKDQEKAMELIGKRYGGWVDKVDLTGDLEVNIALDYGEDESK